MKIENTIAHLLFNNIETGRFIDFIDLSFFNIDEKKFLLSLLYVKSKLDSLELNQFNFKQDKPWFESRIKNVDLKDLYVEYLATNKLTKSKILQDNSRYFLKSGCIDEHIERLNKRGISEEEIKKYHISSIQLIPEDLKEYIACKINIFTKSLASISYDYLDGIIIPCTKSGVVFNLIIRNVDDVTVEYIKYSNCCPEAVFFNIDHLYKEKEVYLCEGVFDAIAIESQGHKASAFSSGVPYIEQLAVIFYIVKNFNKNIKLKLMFDNDIVGKKISFIIKSLLPKNCEEVQYDNRYKDPSQLYKEGVEYAVRKN